MDPPSQTSHSSQQTNTASQEADTSTVTPSESMPDASSQSTASRGGEREGASGRGRGANKRKDLGRKAWARQAGDKREKSGNDQAAKRRKTEDGEGAVPIYATQFSQEDIEAEERRPKKKVAVLMSYSGSGYHGMQLAPDCKTIEGELFPALVAARAISKANAMDPNKSSLVRCARTDKGVHAAGNVVSLKLIVEDPDVVAKINENLTPQIRVWGMEQVTKGFSCYRLCDSRIYEYLIPTHCFIPPHPSTFLARKIQEFAIGNGDLEEYNKRQADIIGYWDKTDDKYIKPILERLSAEDRKVVQDSLGIKSDVNTGDADTSAGEKLAGSVSPDAESKTKSASLEAPAPGDGNETTIKTTSERLSVDEAIKEIRSTYFKAKKTFRIHPDRIARITEALNAYVGTRNFHNYTIKKSFQDPSAKRFIKSFKVSRDPIIINGTEWLSLKVHGQSFMMHQIRKMVAMVALLVRCGSVPERIRETYGPEKVPIPKAPGLGLLLERPIFESYNNHKAGNHNKKPIDFSKYDDEIDKFKEREIYQRIFTEEEETNAFGNFFNHIDTFRGNAFLYLTAGGIPAATAPFEDEKKNNTSILEEVESESEGEVINGGEEGG